jgi:hypothetical protein
VNRIPIAYPRGGQAAVGGPRLAGGASLLGAGCEKPVVSAGFAFHPQHRQMGTVTRQLLALLLLLLQRDNAHAASGDLYKQASLFAIWGRDCQLPYDAERNCSESNNEADALAGLLPPPKAFAPCPDGYSCRCCFSKKDCAPDQGQCAVRQRAPRAQGVHLSWVATLHLSGWVSASWLSGYKYHLLTRMLVLR